jgi:N-acylneuraminate cytidylyltransferase/CMP-N,N'-diacetyllegionaminic acid synthase
MINNKKIIAVIPARSGSKGLPNKNVRELGGKPLIFWTIQAAKQSKYLDEIVVSTDSDQIAKIAAEYGAHVPFIRPKELALDTTPTIDVIKHSLDFFREELNKDFDYTMLLEPTSPLRDVSDIDCALEDLEKNIDATSLVGVALTEVQNPAFLVKIDPSGYLRNLNNETIQPVRRQDIDAVYFLEGSVYVSETIQLEKFNSFYQNKTIGMVIPKWKSLEIDDLEDFIMVEALMRHKELIQ